ncbi:hypothetical protein QOT17_006354 [Balamuthia mandrillaris]
MVLEGWPVDGGDFAEPNNLWKRCKNKFQSPNTARGQGPGAALCHRRIFGGQLDCSEHSMLGRL